MCWVSLIYDTTWGQSNKFLVNQAVELIKYNKKRWQDAYGMMIFFEDGEMKLYLNEDVDNLSNEVSFYKKSSSKKILAIASHDRYATSWDFEWKLNIKSAQPVKIEVEIDSVIHRLFFLFNWNKWNAEEYAIKHNFFEKYSLSKPVLDTDVIKYCIQEYIQNNNWKYTLKDLMFHVNSEMKWACNMILMDEKGVVVWTDEEGVRLLPLSYNQKKWIFVVSSESWYIEELMSETTANAMEVLKAWEMKRVERYNSEDIPVEKYIWDNIRTRLCAFEFLYMMNRNSLKSYKVRYEAWKKLAEIEKLNINPDETVVLYSPNTAFDVAKWLADGLWVEFNTKIIKKNKPDRIFLEQIDKRWAKMEATFEIDWDALEDLFIRKPDTKVILLADDTSVNGLTMKFIVQLVKKWCKIRFWKEVEVHARIWAYTIWDWCKDWAVMNAEDLVMQKYCVDSLNPTDDEIDTISRKYFNSESLQFLSFSDIEALILEHVHKQEYYEPEDDISICSICHDWESGCPQNDQPKKIAA